MVGGWNVVFGAEEHGKRWSGQNLSRKMWEGPALLSYIVCKNDIKVSMRLLWNIVSWINYWWWWLFIFEEWCKCTSDLGTHPHPDPYVFEPLGSLSGSVSQRYGSVDPDPDPYQNVTHPEHCVKLHRLFPIPGCCLRQKCAKQFPRCHPPNPPDLCLLVSTGWIQILQGVTMKL